MWLAVDCGNTRVKWALIKDGVSFSASAAGSSAVGRWSQLQQAAKQSSETWISHVGGETTKRQLRAALRGCSRVMFVKSEERKCGVINNYRPPSALGVDRWLGLVAAREFHRDVIIVSAGTAATIDVLRRDGVFVGGAVLPGVQMSKDALTKHAGLKASSSIPKASTSPLSTNDAIHTGAFLSITGTATLMRRQLLPGAKFVVTGGDAEHLLPLLPRTAEHIPHLPIHGLIRLRGMQR